VILDYHRPNTIDEALNLILRVEVKTFPMGGGTWLNQPRADSYEVVDLQNLGLDQVEYRGNLLEIGATTTLQDLLAVPNLQPGLIEAIRHEVSHNLRQAATVAGTLVASDGRSPVTTAFLALDTSLTLLPGEEQVELGNLLPFRTEGLARRLITKLSIPLNANLVYRYVARSPADQPIVCAAVSRWPSGRTRVALGGYGKAPMMVFDGTEDTGVVTAAQDAYSRAGDQWASAEYRREVAGVLTNRCLQEFKKN
jgi:CO/xanthine dehydrogenase FAD-binding subunit